MSAGRGFDPRAYRDPRPRPWLVHLAGALNRHVVLPHVLRLRSIELPRPDLDRLRSAVRPGAAAFLGPGHPEFMTDWMLDKEVSRRCSPRMAHWAAYEIVNGGRAAQAFWLANNLIANTPGGGGREYSVRWALQGHGVLLHPEGTVSWHGERIGPLVPGIAEMAWETCRRAREAGNSRPVWIVPLVWRLHFTCDVSTGLAREITLFERGLALPASDGLPVEERFAALQWSLLRQRVERLGIPVSIPAAGDAGSRYFEAQRAVLEAVRIDLARRHGSLHAEIPIVVHRVRRALRREAAADPEGARRDRELVTELERLDRFPAALYGRATLSQEAIAENLKRTRAALLTRGFRNALHNTVPVAVGPRIARIRVPEPIAVHESFVAEEPEGGRRRAALLEALRARMQRSLDALSAGIAPEVDRWRRPNPLAE